MCLITMHDSYLPLVCVYIYIYSYIYMCADDVVNINATERSNCKFQDSYIFYRIIVPMYMYTLIV